MCRLSPLESFLETSQFQLLESLSLFVQGTPNRSVFFLSLGGAAPPEARASLCAARERSRAIWKSPALIRSESSIELVEQERGEGEIQPPAIASSKRQSTRGSPCCSYCSLSLSPLPLSRACPARASRKLAIVRSQRRERCRRMDDLLSLSLSSIAAAAAAALSLSLPLDPTSHSPPSLLLQLPHLQRQSQVISTMAALPEIKLFGKWSYEDVEVRMSVAQAVDLRRRLISSLSPSIKALSLSQFSSRFSRPTRVAFSSDAPTMTAGVILEQERMRDRERSGCDGRRSRATRAWSREKEEPPTEKLDLLTFPLLTPPPLFLSLSLALPNPTDPAQNRSTTSPSRTTSP